MELHSKKKKISTFKLSSFRKFICGFKTQEGFCGT